MARKYVRKIKEKTKYPEWADNTTIRKFIEHRANVLRGRTDKNGKPIEFRLTFEEWFQIWADSGHWLERGHGKGKYQMTRLNDLGHYEVGNVEIKTHEDNLKDRAKGTNHFRLRTQA